MNSILLFSLPIFLSLLLFGLQHLAPTLPSALQTPYPVEADLLKNHVGGRHHTLPEGGTMEYYTLFNPNKSPPNTPKTTILALHPSWGTGMGLCRLKFEGVLKILELMKGREVNLLCPTMPGWGTSESYEAFLSGEEYRKQYLKSVADLIGSQSEGVTEIKVLAWEDAAGLVPGESSYEPTLLAKASLGRARGDAGKFGSERRHQRGDKRARPSTRALFTKRALRRTPVKNACEEGAV